ncbi:MAG: UTP--glucose-1-phosphate uridylyltransferase GalU [Burkholderiales bacterium]|nr:UTP--glucose-1-phosphate uridylyltransferase GalU [Phycisphaerae bacterium]
MSVTKTVIPAAGFGTRMLPAAKAIPKEMLPVLDRPTIQYVVEEAAAAGATDVLLVVSRDKKAVEDHFDRHPELEARLSASGKSALLQSIATLQQKIKVHTTRQMDQRGLGHAVLHAREHVGDQAFLCCLGDTIFSGEPSPSQQLIEAYKKFGTTIIGLEEVSEERVERYGIVGGQMLSDGVIRIDQMVEKPKKEDAPSRLAIAARYVLTPDIFTCIDQTPPGKGGEIQLTDAIKIQLKAGPIHGVVLKAKRHDIGNPIDWLKTNLIFAKRDPATWQQIAPLVQSLL